MDSLKIPAPGLRLGARPERRPPGRGAVQRCHDALRLLRDEAALRLFGWWTAHADRAFVAGVRAAQSAFAEADPAAALPALRRELLRDGLAAAPVARAFGLACVLSRRVLGLEPFDVQLIAAQAVLGQRLAEMATGEGKSLTVALAASTAALGGAPVHVVTANDYLAGRDAARFAPLYEALGLRVGAVRQTDVPDQRRQAYACDVTYVTAKELVFDYLRDGAGGGQDRPLLRGLCMAIVDEADAILIDEARTPLILSRAAAAADAADAAQRAAQALGLAASLHEGADFRLDRAAQRAELTPRGRDLLEQASAGLAAAWRNRLHREHSLGLALAALHLFERDRHYIVRDGQVLLVDPTTGRVAAGRAWSDGLQALVEAKEGCAPSGSLQTLAQLTYQRFFRRYFRLGGLSGTLWEARTELATAYGVSLHRVPLHRPCRRRVGPTRLFAGHAALWAAVAERTRTLHRRGQPVLIGTDSVAEAQALSATFEQAGLPHALLHAGNEAHEAEVIARAGEPAAITVTTHMAGRGTDIALGRDVAALGGLHVICCQLNNARRIDRQLAGRAARQGDPGAVETWLSLDNALLARSLPRALRRPLAAIAPQLPSWAASLLARLPQRAQEAHERGQRRQLARHDDHMERQLAFGGPGE